MLILFLEKTSWTSFKLWWSKSNIYEKFNKWRKLLGIIFDGDGDRIAAIDEKGRYSSTQDLLPYFISYLGEIKNNLSSFKDCSGSDIIKNISESQNRDVFELPVGFKYIAEKMIKERKYLEERNRGVGFGDFMPERDALYAAMVLLNGIAEKSQYLYKPRWN